MRLNFQHSITNSHATFPIVSILTLILWFLLPPLSETPSFASADYGLWHLMPSMMQEGWWSLGLSAACAALMVYFLTELNNGQVLLRINSRMISTMLAFLLALAIPCQEWQPGVVVALFMLFSFFPLFTTYQTPSPQWTFCIYLMLSVASLSFPKILWFVPLYWFLQGYLRAFSIRCFMSSIFAVMMPYWFYAGIALITGGMEEAIQHMLMVVDISNIGHTEWSLHGITVWGFTLLSFITGCTDFYIHQFRDKTRTRSLYNVVVFHGLFTAVLIALQPVYVWTLLPVLMLSTSIVFGHFFAQTQTKFSHIFCLLLAALAAGVLLVQYFIDDITLFAVKN
ncbi:MAG: hypothetical protein GXY64_10480 [Bacteroidales bacterium]|nr:hypothetical protein [Bacteroidales bacterium]